PATGTIKVGLSSTFNNGSWGGMGLPNNNGLNAVIAGNYNTSNGNIRACNCTVESGGVLTISANTYAEIQNNITNNGTLIVQSDGNLVQLNDGAVNTGDIEARR